MTNDFYDLLGVDEDASKEEIRDAFREMVQEYHPDRNDDPRATAQFTAIKKAYDTLKNSSERQSYDRLGHSTYVAKRMDGMPDPGSWPSDDEDDDADTSGSSSSRTTAGSGTTGSSNTTGSSSRTTGGSSDAGRSGTSGRGPGSSGSGRASARSSGGSTSRSSTSSSTTSSSSSSTGSSSRSGSGSSRSSSSRSTTSGSSSSTSAGTTSKAGSNGNAARTSAAGSTVGDGGTAQAGAAEAAAHAAAGSAASGGASGTTGRATGSTSEGGSLADNAIVQWLQRALFGWPSIFLSTALYLSGLAYYGYSNRSGLAALAESLRAAGTDTAALRAALEGDRYGVAPATEFVSAAVPGDPAAAAGWLFAAGAVLMPVVYFLVIYTTRRYPGWKPTYLYVVGVTAPAIVVGATVVRGTVPLAAELLAYGVLPGLAIATLLARGFVWPRLEALGK